jgi:hypothetical protein
VRGRARSLLLLSALLSLVACSDRACGGRGGLPPGRLPRVDRGDGRIYYMLDKGAWKGFYDAQGRLAIVEYDSSGDGRADYIAHYDEQRRIRLIEVDEDHDAWVDRFEYYDAKGVLEKVGRWRKQKGRADEWIYRGPDGHPSRIEYDDDGDGRPDRADVLDHGLVVRTETDSDHDGRIDRWQNWSAGRLVSEEIDTDHDGKADRRIVYGPRGQVLRLERLPR